MMFPVLLHESTQDHGRMMLTGQSTNASIVHDGHVWSKESVNIGRAQKLGNDADRLSLAEPLPAGQFNWQNTTTGRALKTRRVPRD